MTQGLLAELVRDGKPATECLVIGRLVPRVHSNDRVPVYLIVAHEDGAPIVCLDGQSRKLLAYPSHLPGPMMRSDAYVYVKHPALPWNAPVPVFDREATS